MKKIKDFFKCIKDYVISLKDKIKPLLKYITLDNIKIVLLTILGLLSTIYIYSYTYTNSNILCYIVLILNAFYYGCDIYNRIKQKNKK